MDRRQFLATAVSMATWGSAIFAADQKESPREVNVTNIPLWRGFNLQEKFSHTPAEWATLAPEWGFNNDRFHESDFEWIAGWGFNFVRLPMSYKCWVDPKDPFLFQEKPLREIDQAVEFGRQYNIHVNINFHRAPGFCVNPVSGEPTLLWTDEKTLDICAHHWRHFATRYKGIPNRRVSFNLLNEPYGTTDAQYLKVVRRLTQEIREVDSNRLIIADALDGKPVPGLKDMKIVQSTRGYTPGELTHYKATWAGSPDQLPTWPLTKSSQVVWDKDRLRREVVQPFKDLEHEGVRVHVGEWGCYRHTPHAVTLSWMRDCLSLWKEVGWGWALWCFRGSFGILNSNRVDVKYESFRGHLLDRKMLELLREF